jgi:transposase-like protein
MENIRTLQEAIIHFTDFQNCRRLMMELRWPDGKVKCPRCGSEKVTFLVKARVWKCYGGHKRPTFSLKTGTIFEDSPLGLDKWLAALWLLVNCKNGVSSCEVARDLGVTQKSAWFTMHRLRFALKEGGFGQFSGEVEADDTFVGGKARNMHISESKRRITGTGPKNKTAVIGILKRGGRLGPLYRCADVLQRP